MPVRHPEDLLLSVQRGPQEPGCGGVGLAASGGQYDEGTVRWGFFLHPVQAHHRLILMLVWVLHIEAFLWGYFPGCQHSGRFRSHHQIPPSHSVVSCSISFFAVPGNMNHPRTHLFRIPAEGIPLKTFCGDFFVLSKTFVCIKPIFSAPIA